MQSKLNLISLLLRYYSNETGPRDPDSEENGQKKKGEKISESKSTAQEGYLWHSEKPALTPSTSIKSTTFSGVFFIQNYMSELMYVRSCLI